MADDILKTLIAEALGEGPEGMRLVAETILNRAAIRDLSPEEVVRQPKQYTGLNSPGPAAKRAWNDPQALSAAQAAWELAQAPGDPTGGADHYYAPGTISQPYWAKSMKPTVEAGGHAFYSSRPLPPGELPQVASALSTVPTPRNAPAPVTPSPRMNGLRGVPQRLNYGQGPNGVGIMPSLKGVQRFADGGTYGVKDYGIAPRTRPSAEINSTIANLSKPTRTLGDSLGMNPVQGGAQQAPMFDAAFDERTGTMRLTREPIDSQGIAVGRSSAPAPDPLLPSAQLAARRATDRTLQAALNRRYPAQLPPLPPPAEAPVRTAVSASDLVRGRSGISTVASIPTTGALPSPEQILNGTGFRGGPIQNPDRLTANALPPALYGGGVAGVGTKAVAPVPFPPYRAVGSQVDTMPPLPMARPTRTATALPIAGMPAASAPTPMTMSPQMRQQRGQQVRYGLDGEMFVRQGGGDPWRRASGFGNGGMLPMATTPNRSPLRITVSGANPIAPPNPIMSAARSVGQSGDYSSGNQFEAANLIASGNAWREAQERKK